MIFEWLTDCCREQGVSEECLSVCELDIDIEAALTKPKCFAELDKLMNCAAGLLSSDPSFSTYIVLTINFGLNQMEAITDNAADDDKCPTDVFGGAQDSESPFLRYAFCLQLEI